MCPLPSDDKLLLLRKFNIFLKRRKLLLVMLLLLLLLLLFFMFFLLLLLLLRTFNNLLYKEEVLLLHLLLLMCNFSVRLRRSCDQLYTLRHRLQQNSFTFSASEYNLLWVSCRNAVSKTVGYPSSDIFLDYYPSRRNRFGTIHF